MPRAWHTIAALIVGGCISVTLDSGQISARQAPPAAAPAKPDNPKPVFDKYCVTCHNQRLRTAGLELDRLDPTNPARDAEVWIAEAGPVRYAFEVAKANARGSTSDVADHPCVNLH